MSELQESEENTAIVKKLKKLGLNIAETPQVSYNDLRLDFMKEAGVFEGAFGKDGGETLWNEFNKNRTDFFSDNRWAQSLSKEGNISLLHANPQKNTYDILDIAQNEEIKMSRFREGQWNWTIENASGDNKIYKSSGGTIICHLEDETTKTKIVLRQQNIGITDVERITTINKETKERMVSYQKKVNGIYKPCDAEGNILKVQTAQ